MSDILITASIGMYVNKEGEHFLQVITADAYNHYFIQITKAQANHLAVADKIEIEEIDGVPDEDHVTMLGGDIH